MAKNKKKKQNSRPTDVVLETQVAEVEVEEVYPKPVARWEILPNNDGEDTLVLYDEDDLPMSYLLLTDLHAGDMVEAMNKKLELMAPEPDEWSLLVPEDSRYTPTLNFYSAGINTAKISLTPETLRDLNPQLLKLYNPDSNKPSSLLPWMNKHKIKTGLLIMLITVFLGYGTFTYFF